MTLIQLTLDPVAKRPALIFPLENVDFIEYVGENHDETPIFKLHWGVHHRTISGPQADELKEQLRTHGLIIA